MSLILDGLDSLSDYIIANGLIRKLAEKATRVVLPCRTKNVPSVEAMFSDLSNVQVLPATSEVIYPGALVIGKNAPGFDKAKPRDQELYRLAGVDFDCRWSAFKLPESTTPIEPPECPYILVDKGSEERALDESRIEPRGADGEHLLRVYVEPRTPRITDWVRMIEEAEEAHCVEGAFMSLVESVPSNGFPALFFHAYAGDSAYTFRKEWIQYRGSCITMLPE